MSDQLTRRRFLELASVAVTAGLAAAVAACDDTLRASLGRAATPKRTTPTPTGGASPATTGGTGGTGAPGAGWQKLGALAALTATPTAFPVATNSDGGDKVFAYASSGKPVVLSSVCTHQGCTVDWKGSDFECPCHGGTYDKTGKVTGGPPPAPLASFPTQVYNGQVYIQG